MQLIEYCAESEKQKDCMCTTVKLKKTQVKPP